MILHHGLNSTEVLIIRKTTLHNREVHLEEFIWNNLPERTSWDSVKLLVATAAFMILAFQIVSVGWMSDDSRLLYLAFGSLGLVANILQAACPPDWSRSFYCAFEGSPRCAPANSSLLGAVGILMAARFPAAQKAAQELYPANERFQDTLLQLNDLLEVSMCEGCREVVRNGSFGNASQVCCDFTRGGKENDRDCRHMLRGKLRVLTNKQLGDAMAAISQVLGFMRNTGYPEPLEVGEIYRDIPLHDWEFQPSLMVKSKQINRTAMPYRVY